MKILLTNDDSFNSCLLPFALEYLEGIGEVKTIVPLHEQSWKGKAMTRFGTRVIEERDVAGRVVQALDGTPADCANVGIYHLFDGRPDLVVSGVNLGLNAGVAFLLSSGTVGGCLEANIAGLPGIALSQNLTSDLYVYYRREHCLPPDVLIRLKEQTALLLPRIFDYLLKGQGLLDSALTWNVNLPYLAAEDTKLRLCSVSQSMYGSFFKHEEKGFSFGELPMTLDMDPENDWQVLEQGHVAISPIDISKIGRL